MKNDIQANCQNINSETLLQYQSWSIIVNKQSMFWCYTIQTLFYF